MSHRVDALPAAVPALVLAAVFAMAATPAAAQRGPIEFTVENRTGRTLIGVYAGPSSEEEWGENGLNREIRDGENVIVTIRRPKGCSYDFRYEFDDNEPYEEYEVDICEIDGDKYFIE